MSKATSKRRVKAGPDHKAVPWEEGLRRYNTVLAFMNDQTEAQWRTLLLRLAPEALGVSASAAGMLLGRLIDLPTAVANLLSSSCSMTNHMPVERDLDSLITQAARVRGYLVAAARGRSHDQAVKASNNLAEQVLRVLGYSYPKDDVNF